MSRLDERVWTPPGRSRRELRNARVKVIGSLLILATILVAVGWKLL